MGKSFSAITVILAVILFSPVLSVAEIPMADLQGSQDSPLLGRYEGSIIVSFEHKNFNEFTMPLSALEPVKEKRDPRNNILFEPKEKKTLEGEYWRLVYLVPEGVSPLEVLRNYQEEIHAKGGEILYECKSGECGGAPERGSSGGGGDMSLAMYLRPDEMIKDAHFSPGSCAQREWISDQRYTVGVLSDSGAHVSVLTYTLKAGHSCRDLDGRTIAAVDIIQPRKREQKMVTVKAEKMAGEISAKGSIALYGIYFDTGKWDIKPESNPTLEEIARLLDGNPEMKLLVVGHTDNAGTFEFNMDLSRKRADSVVNALVDQHGIDRGRLMSVGVSFACPVASNKTEEGKAENRRVELVEN